MIDAPVYLFIPIVRRQQDRYDRRKIRSLRCSIPKSIGNVFSKHIVLVAQRTYQGQVYLLRGDALSLGPREQDGSSFSSLVAILRLKCICDNTHDFDECTSIRIPGKDLQYSRLNLGVDLQDVA